MKNTAYGANSRFFAAILPTFVLALVATAQQTAPPSGTHTFTANTTYDPVERQATAAALVYHIEDDVTVAFQNASSSAAGGVFNANAAARSITIAPSGALGTGRAVFRNNRTIGEGGVLYVAGPVSVTNADFIENSASTNGGVLRNTSASGLIEFNNVLFQGNRAASGGVFASYGNINVTSGTFKGNYTSTYNGIGGVLANYSASLIRPAIFTGAAFIDNRAANGGVAGRYSVTNGVLLIVDAPEISGNWAVQNGGVMNDANNRDNDFYMLIRLNGGTGRDDYVYSGNAALGRAPGAATTGTDALISGSRALLGTAVANAGGFYYTTASSLLRFDIAGGVSLSLGEAGNPAALDSIATADTGTGALIEKKSGGRLVLHADNAYYQGTTRVDAGTLLLGNENARLGGVIEVAQGATFGGSGTLTTLLQNSTVSAGRTLVTATAGGIIRVGMDAADEAEILTVSGSVVLKDGAILSLDLFSSGSASLLRAGSITQEADAKINLGLLENGTFALAEWTAGGLDAGRLALTVNSGAQTARSSGMLFVDGKQLKITNSVSSLEMKWTGAGGAEWAGRAGGQNWSDGRVNAERIFRDGDRVIFDGEADAANPGSRSIDINAAGVTVSDLRVSGGADYVFQGAGGITADALAIDGAVITGSGMLVKSGPGALVFAHAGSNRFSGGIDMAGGVIGFNHAAQLGTAGAGIFFSDSGTLRAAANVSGTLDSNITIAAGRIAGIEVAAQDRLVYSGTLATGGPDSVLRKTGGGALVLLGDSGAGAGPVLVEEGGLLLGGAGARLGGKISVSSGATLGGAGEAGVGGEVALATGALVAAGIDSFQSGTLTVYNLKVTGGAVFQFDLYNDMDGLVKRSDRIFDAGTSQISGTNTIDITTLASGTFNLGNLAGLADNYQVTLNDMVLPSTGRLSAALTGAAGVLQLVTIVDKSRNVTWTGSGGMSWSVTAENWAGSDGVTQYGYGDHVFFDGMSDAANPGNRVISIDGSQVSVSDLTVSGDADYTFTGNGSLQVRTDFAMDDGSPAEITGPQGRLVKSGSGTLTFANDAGNFFEGGIDVLQGVIAFNRADQLDTTGAAITFKGDSSLRADADAMELAGTLAIDAGVTGALDSNGHALTLTGTLLGGADAVFAKTGAGTVLLGAGADITSFSGSLLVRAGTLRVGVADQLTNTGAAVIFVDAGATLDLDGHDQTLSNLDGTGEVALGDATLAFTAASGTSVFAGGFSGEGAIVKQGAGKWILSGSSSHTGGIAYNEGVLGLASSHALGAGALLVNAPDAMLSIDEDGIEAANDIRVETGGVTVLTNARHAGLSGVISGGAVTVKGSGTLALAGQNSYASLTIEEDSRVVARRAESISGPVSINGNSVLEFQDVAAGQVHGGITGNQVLFTSSTLSVLGTNQLKEFVVGARSDVTAAAPGALGGVNANITVRDGGMLRIANTNIAGKDMTIDGGAVVFGADYKMGTLALDGAMNFINGGEVGLGTILPTGIYTAAVAAGGIPAMPDYDPHQGGMFMLVDIIGGDTLQITAYNKALEPGKDITVGFDAMIASMRSVYAHVSEEFLTPLIDREAPAPATGVWFRAFGSFAEYGDDYSHLGYTDSTYAGIIGWDWISDKNYMLGGYIGYSNTSLETANNATTDMDLPYMGLYGAARHGNFYITADFTTGFGSADTKRREDHGNTVTGSHDLDTVGGSVEIGYMFHPFAKGSGSLRPSVGLHYMNLRFHDYAEEGKGAVRIDSFRTWAMQAVFNCDVTKQVTLPWGLPGMVDIGMGWRQNLRTSASDVWATVIGYPGARFQIRGDEYDASSVTGGIGLRVPLSQRMLFAFAYDFDYTPAGNHDSDTVRHTFNSVIRLSW
jgi:autotransporter-associated beta strand protein